MRQDKTTVYMNGLKIIIHFQTDEMVLYILRKDETAGKYTTLTNCEIEYEKIYNDIKEYALNHTESERKLCDVVKDCIEAQLDYAIETKLNEDDLKTVRCYEVIEAIREDIF